MSLFEQTLLGPSPQCCIPSTKIIGPLVWEKLFKGFCHIWMWWPSWSRDQVPPQDFHSLIPLRLHEFGFDWPSGFGEDGGRQWMDGWMFRQMDGQWSLPIL